MFDLRITTLAEARSLLRAGWPARAVSLVCPETPDFACHGPHHLVLRLHDIAAPAEGMVAPGREHLLEALRFTADLAPGAPLLIHCVAGMSRSTAMAIGVLIARGPPWRAAWAEVERIRPCLMPNPRLLALIDEHHGLDGALLAHLRAWRAECEHRSAAMAL